MPQELTPVQSTPLQARRRVLRDAKPPSLSPQGVAYGRIMKKKKKQLTTKETDSDDDDENDENIASLFDQPGEGRRKINQWGGLKVYFK
jgi:hypothetical protein